LTISFPRVPHTHCGASSRCRMDRFRPRPMRIFNRGSGNRRLQVGPHAREKKMGAGIPISLRGFHELNATGAIAGPARAPHFAAHPPSGKPVKWSSGDFLRRATGTTARQLSTMHEPLSSTRRGHPHGNGRKLLKLNQTFHCRFPCVFGRAQPIEEMPHHWR